MEQSNHPVNMLDLIPSPAFRVESGIITQLNPAAKALMLETGIPVNDVLSTGQEEYLAFRGGSLYLSVQAAGNPWGAAVSRIENADIFVLDQSGEPAALQAMALAAKELREPLANLFAMADRLFPALQLPEDSPQAEQAACMNRSLYRLLRTVGNMSDAARYAAEPPKGKETRDICAVLEQILRRCALLAGQAGIELHYCLPQEIIYCPVNEEALERAVYNLISNAIKFRTPDSRIDIRAVHRGKKLYLTIQDTGSGIPGDQLGSVFFRYQRPPAIEDGRFGIGLGMVLVRGAAAIHGGTVLIEQPEAGGTRTTITISTQPPAGTVLRSEVKKVDYSGEHSHDLVELSDVLPASLYYPSKIN